MAHDPRSPPTAGVSRYLGRGAFLMRRPRGFSFRPAPSTGPPDKLQIRLPRAQKARQSMKDQRPVSYGWFPRTQCRRLGLVLLNTRGKVCYVTYSLEISETAQTGHE